MNRKLRKLISLALCAVMALSVAATALADDSTTIIDHVYQDMSPNTEIYVKTSTAGASYPYSGAKYEPKGGVLYGRTVWGGKLPSGQWGLVNEPQNADESIISHYYSLTDPYSLEYWSYLYSPALADGEHAFLVYLNFNNEGEDCPLVVNGTYDSKIRETLTYMESMECPTFLRIGGEMNVWTKTVTPADFIAAYRHVADIARSVAPSVALVFSPNFSGSHKQDMDTFYPGDKYVDWVGLSLYYNKLEPNHPDGDPAFFGVGDIYGDALLNAQMGVNLAKLHNKPLMVTEGGPFKTLNGQDYSAWAAERLSKAMAFLPMVYPQIKAIVNSDYNPGGAANYIFYDNTTVNGALTDAVAALDGVYKSDYNDTGAFLTPMADKPDLSADKDKDVTFYAYTYSSTKLTATWYIDGKQAGTSSSYPYALTVERAKVAVGKHNVEVRFSNGQTKLYGVTNGKVGDKVTPDVAQDYAQPYIDRALAAGILPEDMLHDYAAAITRADFCRLAVALYEKCKGETIQLDPDKSFPDTKDQNVLKMATLGVVDGYPDGTFKPDKTLTRAEAAKVLAVLAEALGKPMDDAAYPFTDKIDDWARNYVGQVYGAEIMNGVAPTTFSAQGSYERQQSVVTMVRMLDYYNK